LLQSVFVIETIDKDIDPSVQSNQISGKIFLKIMCLSVIQTIFIVMGKLNQPIVVRLSDRQVRALTDSLVTEQRNKSQIIRDALNQYLVEGSNKQRDKSTKRSIE
jgi:hypothetical protein